MVFYSPSTGQRLVQVASTILTFGLVFNPSNNQTLHSEYQKHSRKREERRRMRRQSIFSLTSNDWMNWIWCKFCLVTSPTTPTNRTVLHTMQCHQVQHVLVYMLYPCAHTQTNNCKIHTDRGSGVASYELMKEMMERRREKERWKKWKNERGLWYFYLTVLNGRAYQLGSNPSSQ